MPITQDRMISVIIAARDYQQALQQAERYAKQAIDAVQLKQADAFTELSRITMLITETSLLREPIHSATTILLEEKHFKHVKGRNARRADKQAKQRMDAGVPTAATAPKSIIPASTAPKPPSRAEQIAAKPLTAEDIAAIPFQGLDSRDMEDIERAAEAEAKAEASHQRYLELMGKKPAPADESPSPSIDLPSDDDDPLEY